MTWFDDQDQSGPWIHRPVAETTEENDPFEQYFDLNPEGSASESDYEAQTALYGTADYGKILYGNAVKVKIDYGGGHATTTTSTFSNYWAEWLLGRLDNGNVGKRADRY